MTMSIILIFGTSLFSQNKIDKKISKEIDSYLNGQIRSNQPGMAVLVAKNGNLLFRKGFGKANLEWNIPIETNTVFQIGSITKLFTVIGILQLVERQQLSLEDPIQKYIPTFPNNGNSITIEHLLTHTAGIKDYYSMTHPDPNALRRDFKPIEIINFFKDEPLEFDPGIKSSYTNSGYFLLGYIIEVVSGLPYEKFIQENIFEPVGMKNSYYGDYAKVIPNRANSYSEKEGVFENGEFISMSVPYAAGALLSTVEDLYLWHSALFSNELLSKDQLAKSFTAYLLNDGTKGDFGYGWFVDYVQVNGSPTLAHSGGISGFNSLIMYLPKEDILVLTLSNFREAKVEEITTQVAALATGNKSTNEPQISYELLNAYKGKYAMSSDTMRIAEIKELEGKLIIEVRNEWKAELTPVSDSIFNVKNVKPKATLEFAKDEKDEVVKFVINQGGLFEWVKIE